MLAGTPKTSLFKVVLFLLLLGLAVGMIELIDLFSDQSSKEGRASAPNTHF
ncbi:hypothetical protein MTBLM1_90193 [Rhodospirillaceae bacterium LM-1]|nr:hypothetical protein MTBLM1_90193 [Rhodospirillaceae bacterium LM-1]